MSEIFQKTDAPGSVAQLQKQNAAASYHHPRAFDLEQKLTNTSSDGHYFEALMGNVSPSHGSQNTHDQSKNNSGQQSDVQTMAEKGGKLKNDEDISHQNEQTAAPNAKNASNAAGIQQLSKLAQTMAHLVCVRDSENEPKAKERAVFQGREKEKSLSSLSSLSQNSPLQKNGTEEKMTTVPTHKQPMSAEEKESSSPAREGKIIPAVVRQQTHDLSSPTLSPEKMLLAAVNGAHTSFSNQHSESVPSSPENLQQKFTAEIIEQIADITAYNDLAEAGKENIVTHLKDGVLQGVDIVFTRMKKEAGYQKFSVTFQVSHNDSFQWLENNKEEAQRRIENGLNNTQDEEQQGKLRGINTEIELFLEKR